MEKGEREKIACKISMKFEIQNSNRVFAIFQKFLMFQVGQTQHMFNFLIFHFDQIFANI